MLMCNHKICINVMLCLWNCTVVKPQMPFQMSIGQFRITCSLHHPIRHVLDNTPACRNSSPSIPPPSHYHAPLLSHEIKSTGCWRIQDNPSCPIPDLPRVQQWGAPDMERSSPEDTAVTQQTQQWHSRHSRHRRHSSNTGRECTEM